jgi:hypothetical protein
MPDAPPEQTSGNTPEDKKIFLIALGLIVVYILITIAPAVIIFGMAGSTPRTYTVAATAAQRGNNIMVTWQGGRDNSYVRGYTVAIAEDPVAYPQKTGEGQYYQPIIGETHTFPGGTDGYDRVQVTAALSNGGSQIILDTYV